jgi:D-cysteine desulfhydrase family pyridoxal phosphate-dependent enzyme
VSRRRLATLPTPLEPLPRLGAHHGVPRLFVKRDDLTGLALGGNKARKLELLCADALDQGCDTLVTGGGVQSNHARMTAAAASRLGLACHLVLGGPPRDRKTANLLLDHLFGATLHFTTELELEAGADSYYGLERAITDLADRVRRHGARPYTIPIGGASTVGAVAYVLAADELAAQLPEAGITGVDTVVVADGSGGTHAGLLAGLPSTTTIVGVDVGTRPDLDEAVPSLAADAARACGRPLPTATVIVDHDHIGDGYGALTDAALGALQLAARSEGIALDPVYSAKAMAALVARVEDGRIDRATNVVFWHTGGAVALFSDRYAEALSALEGGPDPGR